MVQFPRSRPRALCIQARVPSSRLAGYPIRQPADQRVCAPPRRFSQLAAAFFALARQGIRRKPSSRLTILSSARKNPPVSSQGPAVSRRGPNQSPWALARPLPLQGFRSLDPVNELLDFISNPQYSIFDSVTKRITLFASFTILWR